MDHASDIIVSWLWVIEAEAHANIYASEKAYTNTHASDTCFQALEHSESLLERGRPGAASYSFSFADARYSAFSTVHLLGYKGVCNMRLQKPQAAQAFLQERLDTTHPIRIHKKSITLVDLATTYVQLGEVEEACKYVTQALNILEQTRSARVFQRVLRFRQLLDSYNTTSSVRNLDALIVTVLPSIKMQGAL